MLVDSGSAIINLPSAGPCPSRWTFCLNSSKKAWSWLCSPTSPLTSATICEVRSPLRVCLAKSILTAVNWSACHQEQQFIRVRRLLLRCSFFTAVASVAYCSISSNWLHLPTITVPSQSARILPGFTRGRRGRSPRTGCRRRTAGRGRGWLPTSTMPSF